MGEEEVRRFCRDGNKRQQVQPSSGSVGVAHVKEPSRAANSNGTNDKTQNSVCSTSARRLAKRSTSRRVVHCCLLSIGQAPSICRQGNIRRSKTFRFTRENNEEGAGPRAQSCMAETARSLLVALAPRLQRRQFKQTRRQLECQLRLLLQVVRARGSASEDGARGCSVQYETQDMTALQNG